MTTETQTNDIVAIATDKAKTLTAAVKAASLVETLKGKGLFTVFAPTDAAFSSIQKDVDSLLKPENKTKTATNVTTALTELMSFLPTDEINHCPIPNQP